MEEIKAVSVICNVYNHEKYLSICLEGFAKQKTNFSFEVLVHDDASTDRSAEIIREYTERYPDIFKPIYEEENQYSKHDGSLYRIQYGRATGKYIALCEGDDYWTDENKLQKQFDFMEAHPEFDMCCHATEVIDGETGESLSVVMPRKNEGVLTTRKVIKNGGGYVSTNSLFYRRTLHENEPEFRKILKLDYTIQILGSLKNGIYFFPETMSCYRKSVPQSWTARMRKNPKKMIDHFNTILRSLAALNRDTSYKYFFTILYCKLRTRLKIAYLHIKG